MRVTPDCTIWEIPVMSIVFFNYWGLIDRFLPLCPAIRSASFSHVPQFCDAICSMSFESLGLEQPSDVPQVRSFSNRIRSSSEWFSGNFITQPHAFERRWPRFVKSTRSATPPSSLVKEKEIRWILFFSTFLFLATKKLFGLRTARHLQYHLVRQMYGLLAVEYDRGCSPFITDVRTVCDGRCSRISRVKWWMIDKLSR